VCTHDAGSFHRVGVVDLVASRLSATHLAAILIYGTEGQRFESSRARSLSAWLLGFR
jgi:hypothetical protein